MSSCKTITNVRYDERKNCLEKLKAESLILNQVEQKVNASKQVLELRNAIEAAEYKAAKKAETEFKIKQGEILKEHLDQLTELSRKQQEQAKTFISFIETISEKLNNPASIFPISTIVKVEALEDYYAIEFKDGRRLNIPNGALNILLSSFLDAVHDKFNTTEENIAILENRVLVSSNNINKLTSLFSDLINNIADKENSNNAKNLEFQTEIYARLAETEAGVQKLASALQTIIQMASKLNAAVTILTERE